MTGKLTEEQMHHIAEGYRGGKSTYRLAEEYGTHHSVIERALERLGVERRTLSEAQLLRRGKRIDRPSAEALRKLYWEPEHGHPNTALLGEIIGVAAQTAARWLKQYGIPQRKPEHQLRIDLATGRRRLPSFYGEPHKWSRETAPKRSGTFHPRARQARKRAQQAAAPPIVRPCSWCGEQVRRKRCAGLLWERSFCCVSHLMLYRGHVKRSGADAPRPAIVERLKQMLSEPGYRTSSVTPHSIRLEYLERAGTNIGATDAEYAEIIVEWAQGS